MLLAVGFVFQRVWVWVDLCLVVVWLCWLRQLGLCLWCRWFVYWFGVIWSLLAVGFTFEVALWLGCVFVMVVIVV